MKKLLLFILIPFLLFSCEKKKDIVPLNILTSQIEIQNTLSIMSFNIQILGKTKIAKQDVMKTIIDIIDDYDLIAIQEIRDASDTTLTSLMKMMPPNYKIVIGPREGRTISKEQSIYIYNDNKLDVLWSVNYEDINDVYERSPFLTSFESDDKLFGFIMINTHISPGDANKEISELSKTMLEVFNLYKKEIVLVGDFNADGSYFDENLLEQYFPDDKYEIVITNDMNTTVSTKDNTYDRIIITDGLEVKVVNFGVLDFKDYLVGNTTLKDVSDHYPVYMVLQY